MQACSGLNRTFHFPLEWSPFVAFFALKGSASFGLSLTDKLRLPSRRMDGSSIGKGDMEETSDTVTQL